MTEQQGQYYSQYGEDKILHDIFGEQKNGVCIEVGGYDGVTGSTTLYFEKLGWKAIVIEPMPDFCDKIRQARNCELVQVAASDESGVASFYVAEGVETLSTLEQDKSHANRVGWEGGQLKEIKVQKLKLDDILTNLGVSHIDFMTIDVEGHEMSALRGLSLQRFQPKIIIVEDSSHGLNREVKNYLAKCGYTRFKITGCNDWYARETDGQLVSRMGVFLTEGKSSLKIVEALVKAPLKALLPRKQIEFLAKLIK